MKRLTAYLLGEDRCSERQAEGVEVGSGELCTTGVRLVAPRYVSQLYRLATVDLLLSSRYGKRQDFHLPHLCL